MDSSSPHRKGQQAEAVEATIATAEAQMEEQLNATVTSESPNLQNAQQVKFEWLPIKCNHYLMFGHEGTFCRKKEMVRKEWRPIQKEEHAVLAIIPLTSQPKNPEEEIWIAWRPSACIVNILSQSEQMVHCQVTQLSTNEDFCITFQRQPLWTDLYDIAQEMTFAWSIIGDFNSVIYRADRQGGSEVTDYELEDMTNFTEMCELQEINWSGSYYSWTNKTIRSRIDRAFYNAYWWETFDYTHTNYLTNALSDHTPPSASSFPYF
ncbi:hypothetical protein Cgig2_032648 [Carnegiea gigantea]|uniref:Uncharacterized protein n=1 Tax=Carnegiea gigantea TaxID=171969 RepID=A0A9Q1GI20_9CARY|nr:hypothetical protein Cgig2_032648 [Carnegiea gigantea]